MADAPPAETLSLPSKLAEVMAEVGHVPKSDCHLWPRCLTKNGYGSLTFGQVRYYAHRVAYEASHGPIPADHWIDHLCRNRACVNPDHLEAVAPAENCRRGAKTKLTADAVATIRSTSDRSIDLARRYGVSAACICNIRAGRRWAGV